jgi:hypothetical protein
MDLPTWTKEELDVMCARMDALVEVSNLLYDIQWHRLNWERAQTKLEEWKGKQNG